MGALNQVINIVVDLVWLVIIAHIVMSWLINFQVLNIRQPQVAKIWYGLERILDPIYAPLRRLLPPMSGIDLTPLIVLVALTLIRGLVPGPGLF